MVEWDLYNITRELLSVADYTGRRLHVLGLAIMGMYSGDLRLILSSYVLTEELE